MDIDLGNGMDGTEAAGVILSDRDIPIVFLSNHTEPEIVEKTEQITCYGYISKNSSPTVLSASVKMAFKLFEAKTISQETNRKLEATLDALPDLFFEVGADGRYYDVHCPDSSLLYLPAELLLGRRVPDVLPPDVSGIVMSAIDEASRKGVAKGYLYRLSVPSGHEWFEISVSRMQTPGDESRFIMICRDVTERERADAALQESKRYAESLLNVSAEIIMATDREGAITLFNDNGHRLLGYEPGELIGRNWIDTGLPADVRAGIRGFLATLMRSADETLVPHENDVLCKDGGRKRILWHNTVLRDSGGRVAGVLSSGEDVSAYKELEERYRTIVETSPDIITVTDLQGRILMYSPKALSVFGIEDGSAYIGASVTDFIVPEDRARAGDNLGRMMSGESLGVEEYRGLRADGSAFDIEINGDFIRDRERRPVQILFIGRDITKRKRLIGMYQMLFDLSPVGIALFDYETGQILESNASLRRMTGYDEAELLGLTIVDLTAPEHVGMSTERIRALDRSGLAEAYTKEYVRKDGTRLPVSVNSAVFIDSDQRKVVWGLIEDISKRREAEKRVEEALAEKELVLKEVHHRIKNNFSVIQGLLGLQSGTAKDEASVEAFRSTESRVRSMALLYEKLYESADFVEASIAAYLPALAREVTSNFTDIGKVTVEADVEEIMLDAKRLQALGIVCNELVTNSMKHAFRGRERGTIFVRAGRRAGKVVVTIGDDGVGLPDGAPSDSNAGFGMTLVTMLAGQLHAGLRFERGGGTRTILEFDE